ncbi:MAG: tripartite tricarboxylate transporter TctB family protein [Burkholderiales bacterium]|nr:tripartite tricarboxylate transporter TctB family protein [Burkholderiales bacterium]
MSIESSPDDRPSPRADLVSAVVWMALGGAIVYGSWTMDRLEHLGATVYTAPGLVPGALGAVIFALGALLGVRAVRQGALTPAGVSAVAADTAGRRRMGLALALMLVYAAGMLGHGVPFWLATFAFVAVFVAVFEYPMRKERGQVARGLFMAVLYGAATTFLVTVVFEQVFYVRLP